MTRTKYIGALIAIGVLTAQPCVAATDRHFSEATPARSSAFAGLSVRLPLGQAKPAKPVARLQLTTAFSVRDARTGLVRSSKANGLELGALRSGKPALYLNGRSAAEYKTKLGVSGTTKTVLIVGGLLLVGVVVLAAAAGGSGLGDTCPEFEGSRDHCIDP